MASYRIAILITISKRYCPEGVSKKPCKDPVYPAATSSNTQQNRRTYQRSTEQPQKQ